jgi:aminoglycoside 3-N-acetyltransferase I
MPMDEMAEIRRLTRADVARMQELNALFGDVFEDPASYCADPPDPAYLADLLGKDHVIAVVALADGAVIGGLVAYELDKLERARREIYIYDLAVLPAWRRRGVATALIRHVQDLATQRGAWMVFVQADHGDDPAIRLYESLGTREEVLHFDIPPREG